MSDERHPADTAPGDRQTDETGSILHQVGVYAIGLLIAAALTGVSFLIATTNLFWTPSLPVALIVLAIAQMGVHLVFFIHLNSGPDSTNNVLALAFGLLIVLLLIAGSLFIVENLNHNMLPMNEVMKMQR